MKTALPAKWCVLRTAENATSINDYLNRKQGLDGFYMHTTVRWITNETKKGGQGPKEAKPTGFTELTFEEFMNLCVNQGRSTTTTGAVTSTKGTLPEFWTVKADASERFRTVVIPYFNSLRTAGNQVAGTANAYYGFDGESRVVNGIQEFSRSVTVLSVDEFVSKLQGTATATTIAPVQAAVRPIVATRELFPIDYKLIKRYPGVTQAEVNNAITATHKGINIASGPAFFDAEFWEPVMGIRYIVGDDIIVTNNRNTPGTVNGALHKVTSVRADAYGRQLVSIDVLRGGREAMAIDIRLATADEVNNNAYPLIANLRSIPTQQGTINIGQAAGFTVSDLGKLKILLGAMPGNVTINIGNTNLNEEKIDELLEQLD